MHEPNIVTFYTQALGSSHEQSQKPCQDNGLCYSEQGIDIAIVCDGHGGETYVRSHIGSQLAAKVAQEKILQFIQKTPVSLFSGKKGAVTCKPLHNPLRDKWGNQVPSSALTESQREVLKQYQDYYKESDKYPEMEKAFRTLFKEICDEWSNAIRKDAKERAFTVHEKQKLGYEKRVEKAYGTTLIASVRTKNYWFAFHIGDGKLFVCDKLMQWTEPVPWDCNCFMNMTTSLCDHSPVDEFRYAFDGTGEFPVAIVLGSDGINDTFIHMHLIHKFYSQLLTVFNERDKGDATKLLAIHLAELSKKGSHDDMSIGAIINKSDLQTAVDYYRIITEVRLLKSEREQRQRSIEDLQKEYDTTLSTYRELRKKRDEQAYLQWHWWLRILAEKADKIQQYSDIQSEMQLTQAHTVNLAKQISSQNTEFDKWLITAKQQVDRLKESAEAIKRTVYPSQTEQDSPVKKQQQVVSSMEDSPSDVYMKSAQASLSEEDIARMDKESEAQVKEIFTRKERNK